MKRVTSLVAMVTALGLWGAPTLCEADSRLKVAATLPVFADLAEVIGGSRVKVSSIAPAQFNPHFIEPKPSDVVLVKRADLFIHAGLDLELWRWPLLDAAGNHDVMSGGSRELDLSRGIQLLEVPDRPMSRAEGDIHLYGNPHYWLNPENGKIMAQAITAKLSALDPAHTKEYEARLEAWSAKLDAKLTEWRSRLAPYQGQELVGDHKSWPYFMQFTGLRMEQFLEPKPGIPPTPKQVAFLENYIPAHRVRVIVQSTFFPGKAAETLAGRTGAKVALLCQNVHEVPEAGDYIAMVDTNVNRLIETLR